MWALGIIIFEMATKKHPISKEIDIIDSNQIEIPSNIPPLIGTVIAKLLDKNPSIRPSAADLLN
jgi:serine/threonine protein kinase